LFRILIPCSSKHIRTWRIKLRMHFLCNQRWTR
jgi:hypothetical protein